MAGRDVHRRSVQPSRWHHCDGRYRLTVRAAQVTLGGQSLDGNGDGLGDDDYTLDGSAANGLYRLYGDATGDGVINAFDFAAFRTRFGSSVP